MGLELMKAAALIQRAVQSAPPKRKTATVSSVNTLLKKRSCRSIYALSKVDFSQLSRKQHIDTAEKMVKRATRWFKALGNRIPNAQEGLELRFFVKSFMNLALDSGALGVFEFMFATRIYLPNNATDRQIKAAIPVLKSDVQKVKKRLVQIKSVHAHKIDRLIKVLDMVEKYPQLAEGWSWLVASEKFIQGILYRCK